MRRSATAHRTIPLARHCSLPERLLGGGRLAERPGRARAARSFPDRKGRLRNRLRGGQPADLDRRAARRAGAAGGADPRQGDRRPQWLRRSSGSLGSWIAESAARWPAACTPIRSPCLDRMTVRTGRVIRAFLPGANESRGSAPIGRRGAGARSKPDAKAGCSKELVGERSAYRLRIHWPTASRRPRIHIRSACCSATSIFILFNEGRHFELAKCLGAQSADDRRRQRRALCGLGAECRARRRRRRFQFLGSPPASRCGVRHGAGIWELFVPRVAPGIALQIRILGPGGEPRAAEGRPGRPPDRNAAQHRLGRRRSPTDHVWHDEAWMQRAAGGRRPTRRSRSTRSISDPG